VEVGGESIATAGRGQDKRRRETAVVIDRCLPGQYNDGFKHDTRERHSKEGGREYITERHM
jgi:hypothetical protein